MMSNNYYVLPNNSSNTPKGWGVLLLFLMLALYFYYQPSSKFLPPITYILVEKNRHKMTVYHNGLPLKEYKVALGFQPKGHKLTQGDGKTPEGLYKITFKNKKSKFHLSLKVSYPNEKDIAQAYFRNVVTGNDIMIHGLRNGFGWLGKVHTLMDWTKGCIAVTNSEIEEIYNAIPLETPVEIRP